MSERDIVKREIRWAEEALKRAQERLRTWREAEARLAPEPIDGEFGRYGSTTTIKFEHYNGTLSVSTEGPVRLKADPLFRKNYGDYITISEVNNHAH